jgi:hypothetical protein
METESRLKKSKVHMRTISQRWRQCQLHLLKNGTAAPAAARRASLRKSSTKNKHTTLAVFSKVGKTNKRTMRRPVNRRCQKHALGLRRAVPLIRYVAVKQRTQTADQQKFSVNTIEQHHNLTTKKCNAQ